MQIFVKPHGYPSTSQNTPSTSQPLPTPKFLGHLDLTEDCDESGPELFDYIDLTEDSDDENMDSEQCGDIEWVF